MKALDFKDGECWQVLCEREGLVVGYYATMAEAMAIAKVFVSELEVSVNKTRIGFCEGCYRQGPTTCMGAWFYLTRGGDGESEKDLWNYCCDCRANLGRSWYPKNEFTHCDGCHDHDAKK